MAPTAATGHAPVYKLARPSAASLPPPHFTLRGGSARDGAGDESRRHRRREGEQAAAAQELERLPSPYVFHGHGLSPPARMRDLPGEPLHHRGGMMMGSPCA